LLAVELNAQAERRGGVEDFLHRASTNTLTGVTKGVGGHDSRAIERHAARGGGVMMLIGRAVAAAAAAGLDASHRTLTRVRAIIQW
jgi:hypothetical protein